MTNVAAVFLSLIEDHQYRAKLKPLDALHGSKPHARLRLPRIGLPGLQFQRPDVGGFERGSNESDVGRDADLVTAQFSLIEQMLNPGYS